MKPLKNKDKVITYKNECISLYDIIDGVKTISSFINEVENLSKKYNPLEINTFKGDMLEIFAEIFFGAFRNLPEVGIREYEPINVEEDYGVDAIGINVNNDKCAIQIKYRVNPIDQITYADLARTYTAANLRHNLLLINDNTLFLFTTTYEATSVCKEVFGKKLRVINRNVIAGKIDNNNSFWDEAQTRVILTLEDGGLVLDACSS